MSGPRRLLLVDDEPRVVHGLQRLLRPYRASWAVSVATSGAEALQLLDAQPFEVVVSDMRMPSMDGAALLAMVRKKHPATMRIILSGQTDASAAIRVFPVAHQFLSKPTDPSLLLDTLNRVASARDAISDARVQDAIGGLAELPSRSTVCTQICQLLESEETSIDQLARAVERDPAIVLKVLQVANYAFFNVGRRISSVTEAIKFIGTEMLRCLVLEFGIANSLPSRSASYDAAAEHDHALEVAGYARRLAEAEQRNTAFVAGLLHDIGKLVMASAMPDDYDEIEARARRDGVSFCTAEAQLGHPGHMRIGACLLDLWGLPFDVVEALVRFEDAPSRDASSPADVADVLHFAHRIAASSRDGEPFDEADAPYISRLAIGERIATLLAERRAEAA